MKKRMKRDCKIEEWFWLSRSMKRQIAELEQTLVQPRSWELQGETTGASREENGLLEVDLDVDRIGVSAPVSTVESTLSLEDMIKVILTDVSNAAKIEISNLHTKENEETKDE